MQTALSKLIFLLIFLPGTTLAQESNCTGETFTHLLSDEQGHDLRITCALTYPGPSGDLLLGGGVGGHIVLSRLDRQGNLRWRRVVRTGSESTELSTLNELVVDQAGNIAGVGTTFNDNIQQAYLFRYDPNADSLLYFLQPDFISSELTGIKILNGDEYLLLGSRLGEAFPVFISAYSQQVNQTDGQPSQAAIRYDYRGDESFLDASLAPDGTRYVVGNVSATGGTGDIRASVSRITANGTPEWTQVGPVRGTINGRLYAFDVELVDNQLFVLHWGNIGNITGGINTTVYLSCLDPGTGTLLWNRSYDLTDFNGEFGIELQPHNGGLLIYGISLIGKRDPWLMKLSLTGEVNWARSYEIPGNALLYLRANQQLHTDDTGITALASFSYTDGSPRKGLVLRLDPNGLSDAGCLNVRSLEVSVEPLTNDWQNASLETNELITSWNDAATGMEAANFTAADDCNMTCEDCSARSLLQTFVCREDSVFIAGAFRRQAGVYADTLPSSISGCDSIQFTELIISNGPSATYSVRRDCGLAEAKVRISASGLALPLSFSWSASGANGNTAYLPAGNYQVTVNNAIQCRPLVLEVLVDEVTRSSASLQVSAPVCPGDSSGTIRLEPPGSGDLKLLPLPNFIPDVLTGLPTGEYQLIVRDSTGCEVFRQVSVPPAGPVSIEITGAQRVRLGDETLLAPASGPDQNFVAYNWTLPNSSATQNFSLSLQPTTDGIYRLTAVTDRGCTATDSILLNVYRAAPRLYLPTAFSPNDDAVNDVFAPGVGPEIEAVTKWEIFDRWGNLRWALRGENWWDGKDAAPGVYVYYLEALLIDGSTVALSGQVTILR
ncbi:MAG: hypothetical protein ACJATN_002743 [Neolewinella sp.]|jgi:hypothetical protein